MSTRRATIADVARRAGVSPSTASVVFSGKTPVSDATRARVLDAATALGYTGPDPRAASLRRGRSGIVGVMFQEPLRRTFEDPVRILTMEGLAAEIAPLGAGLLLLQESRPGPTLMSAPLDAAVLMRCSDEMRETLAQVTARGIPVVAIEGDAGPGVPRIDLDDREAQRTALAHLRALGHERVSLVTLPPSADREAGWLDDAVRTTNTIVRERLRGARDIYPDAPAYAAATSSIDAGIRAGRVLFRSPGRRPTAVAAQSDLLAAGVIRAAEEAGLRVPADVSVTGFDGITVDGLAPHRLTTLVQPAVEKGRAAGRAVAAMLAGGAGESVRLECRFREGTTTTIAPS